MASVAPALTPSELVLARYRPLRPLGSGGSGSVWLARDEQTGLEVALKIVPREGKAAARAEREAAAAARLRHRSCLRAYAFARDSRNVYIAYEYVPGRTFREALRSGELKDADAVAAAAQICEGLAHAHAAGILHRDVKPSNVLLAEGSSVSVRLLDFGLARIQEAETLTAAGDVPGTLAYISPERLGGDDATPASDVWAVGVMLWEALAGYHPFWSASLLETARAIETGAQPLRSVRGDLPKPLAAAVDRALAPNPARRPPAAELAATLRGAAPVRRRSSRKPLQVQAPVLVRDAGAAVAAVLAGVYAGGSAALFPFFPALWWVGLGLVAAAATVWRERAGLAVALAVPVLPLGNVSLGLALLYGGLAVGLLALSWREPRSALVLAAGPLLAPLSLLGLVPLAAAGIRSPVRRAVQAAAAVLLAGIAAGVRGVPLPFTGARPPLAIGIANARGPLDVAGSLWHALAAHGALGIEALVLAVAAVALPYARTHKRWGAAGLGAFLLAATLLPVPGAHALPLVITAWITSVAVIVRAET